MRWIEELAKRLKDEANVSAAVNVAKGRGQHTHVERHQKVVQRNGETTIVTEETHVQREEPDNDRQA